MTDQYTIDEFLQLANCAILRQFNHELLRAIGVGDDRWIKSFLMSDRVQNVQSANNTYRLREDLKEQVLERLRSEYPDEETNLHTRAFHYFLGQMQQRALDERREEDEDACLHHLDALFFLIGSQMGWRTIQECVLVTRNARPQQLRHINRLMLYEGYAAIRTQHYVDGEAILTQLLTQASLEIDIRLQALRGLAQGYWYRTLYDLALEFYRRAYSYAVEINNRLHEGLALLGMSTTYHELEQYEQALDCCVRSREIFHEQGELLREGHSLYHAGLFSMYLGRWDDAHAYNTEAAQLYEQLGLLNYLGFVYWQQGYLNHILGDDLASEDAYLRALPLAESPEHGQPSLAMDVWLYLGLLYHTQGRWDTALEHYKHALAFATQLDRQHQICLIHYRRAQALYRLGRLDEAYAAYAQAIDGIEALGGVGLVEAKMSRSACLVRPSSSTKRWCCCAWSSAG